MWGLLQDPPSRTISLTVVQAFVRWPWAFSSAMSAVAEPRSTKRRKILRTSFASFWLTTWPFSTVS